MYFLTWKGIIMPFDKQQLSGRIADFLLQMKEQLGKRDTHHDHWLALHYPSNRCVLTQQRQRVLGMAIAVYTSVTGRFPTETEKQRVLEWVRRNPFVVVDEHLALQLFIRLHSNVPVSQVMVTSAPRQCCKFSYPLVIPELVGK